MGQLGSNRHHLQGIARGTLVGAARMRHELGDAKKVLNRDTINKGLVAAQYAVRGELAIEAERLSEQLLTRPGSLPFESIVSCNIGNPQQLRQKPLTYVRQVLSLAEWPQLMDECPEALKCYPADVVDRARALVASLVSAGAYTHSQGFLGARQSVADYIAERDGYPCEPQDVFMTNGASDAVNRILKCVITSEKIGIMIPIPQYPLYSATIALLRGTAVPYYLDESDGWSLSVAELERAVGEARDKGIDVRVLCIINPGNPTGNCFGEETLRAILEFCRANRVLLLADEVYQANVYGGRLFTSARRVAAQAQGGGEGVEVISLHSISKGLMGECGHRGGYFECFNIDSFVKEQLYKLSSICLCANVPGQIIMQLMLCPPKAGEPSFELYDRETREIHDSLARRAERLHRAFESMSGVTCEMAAGAMYLFPRLSFPERFLASARAQDKPADQLYAMDLLRSTGICVVPGSGFGQRLGTFHIRSTFLPPEDGLDRLLRDWCGFHQKFTETWK